MTDEEIRIAVAEVCGWKDLLTTEYVLIGLPPSFTEDMCPEGADEDVPDYPHDLNAVNQAERYAKEHLMDADQWENYGHWLYRTHPNAVILNTYWEVDYYDLASLLTELTARQRCEGLLKTLDKWVD